MTADPKPTERVLDVSREVPAPASAVWEALTNSEELMRWFAPLARVEPGLGGSIFMSWGDGVEGTGPIEVWEPNRQLRIRQGDATVDFFLEARGESTIMRIVQSGFGADASFDDQYESTENGWAYFLYNLEHYLTRHRGQPRHMISLRTAMNVTREEAWPALTGPDSLDISPPQPSAGAPCRIRLGGRHYSGKVILCRRARVLACTVNELNDGLLLVEFEGGQPGWRCGLWLSVYGARPPVDELRAALAELVQAPASQAATR